MQIHVYGDTLCALVTATALASTGNQVKLCLPAGTVCDELCAGKMPFEEQQLAGAVAEQRARQRLHLADDTVYPDPEVAAVFLAVSPHSLDFADRLMDGLASAPEGSWLVVNQTNFPVGTTESLRQRLQAGACKDKREVVCVPDMLREGVALQSFMRPAHLVVGSASSWAERMVREIYRPFNRLRDTTCLMTLREAEFTRLAINGMLATRLGFINDLAILAEQLNVDIEQVRQGMGGDPRIGEAYLYPGCGFGGLNFSYNVMSLADTLGQAGVGSELLQEVLRINERQKEVLFRKLWCHYGADLAGRRIAIWGVSFKPGTDRIDNAPSLKLLEALWAQNVVVQVHDPSALPALRLRYGERADLVLANDPYDAVKSCDALLLVTEWKDYWSPDFAQLKTLMHQPVLLDGRNIYDPLYVQEQGFTYYGIGRGGKSRDEGTYPAFARFADCRGAGDAATG